MDPSESTVDYDAIAREIESLEQQRWSSSDPEGRAFAPLADAHRRRGELGWAREIVEEGLERLPNFASGHVVAAQVYLDADEQEKAAHSLERVVALDPENVLALRTIAEMALEDGDWERARTYFERARFADPDEEGVEGPDGEGAEALWKTPDEIAEASSEAGGDVQEAEPIATDSADPVEEAVFDDSVVADFGAPIGENGSGLSVDSEGGAVEDAADFGSARPVDLDEASMASGEIVDDWAVDEGSDSATNAADEVDTDIGETDHHEVGGPAIPVVDTPEEAPSDARLDDPEGLDEAVPISLRGSEVYTRTMAELYAQQGLIDRAIAVYERLVEAEPENLGLADRLAGLRRERPTSVAASPETDTTSSAMDPPIPSIEDLAPDPVEGPAASADSVGATESERGVTTGAYFARMLEWSSEDREDVVSVDELAPTPIDRLAPDS